MTFLAWLFESPWRFFGFVLLLIVAGEIVREWVVAVFGRSTRKPS